MLWRLTVVTLYLVLSLIPCSAVAAEQAIDGTPAPAFTVGPGDEIEILVWRDEYLSREVVVQPDGYISFPLIDEVLVSGLTVREIRAEITDRIREFLPDALHHRQGRQTGEADVIRNGERDAGPCHGREL